MNIISILFSFLSGVVGSMGLGGGSILIIYLSSVILLDQRTAQGINILFFIPCAIYALIFYFKEKLIIKKVLLPLITFGITGVITGLTILPHIDSPVLTKAFGGFLIFLSIKNIIKKIKTNRSEKKI